MRGFVSSKLRIHAMRQKACRMVPAPALFVLLVATGVQPGHAQAMSLEEALASAYLTNPTILSHRARLQAVDEAVPQALSRSEEHPSELQSIMRNSYAGFCLKKKKKKDQ